MMNTLKDRLEQSRRRKKGLTPRLCFLVTSSAEWQRFSSSGRSWSTWVKVTAVAESAATVEDWTVEVSVTWPTESSSILCKLAQLHVGNLNVASKSIMNQLTNFDKF